MKKLGFGLMRLPLLDPNDEASIDLEMTKKMVDAFIERGYTYFDTALMYCGENSENMIKPALVDRYPRDAYTLATKLHVMYLRSMEDRDRIFNEQRERTGVEFFDYYLIHGVSNRNYNAYKRYDCFNWIREKKQQGLVKTMGFSFHGDPELLDKVFTEQPDMEFVQLQINYLDWENQFIQSKACYDVAVKHGKKVFVMEPVKGGTLARIPAEAEEIFKAYAPDRTNASWALRFVASLENVQVVLSGMSNMEQIEDNLNTFDNEAPLSDEERECIAKVGEIIRNNTAVPCTGCAYCVDGCPMNIPIPRYFSLYNDEKREVDGKGWTPNVDNYFVIAKLGGKASACVECGQCESVCPQHLPIIDYLKDVAKFFEESPFA